MTIASIPAPNQSDITNNQWVNSAYPSTPKPEPDENRKVPRGHIIGKTLDVDPNGKLCFQNGTNREEVRVVVHRKTVHVGCVRITKKALDLLLEKIELSQSKKAKA